MIKKIIQLCMFLGFTSLAAQTITVTGTITDGTDPLPGASVVIDGSEAAGFIGTVTDIDGRFSIVTKPDDILTFSFLGFMSQSIPVQGRSEINVILEEESSMVDEVVIVGYGIQKKASVVASISQASGDDILQAGSNNNISQAIQGIMPGVVSISGTGKPGAEDATIQIRGVGTWADASPLILVDGIERSMNNVDPNEIESISVLKDASATAVFGVKGGNGVILITTKRGKAGKPVISFSSEFGVKKPTSKPEFSDHVTAMEMWNEALVNDGQWDKLIPESTIEAWRQNLDQAGPYNDYFPEIDWYDELVKPLGYQHKYNVNVRGGSEFMRYFASLGYLWDDDIFKSQPNDLFDPSYYYKRYNWRVNFDFDVTKTTIFSINLAGNQGIRNQNGYRFADDKYDDDSNDNFFGGLYTAASNQFPIKWSDGEWGTGENGQGNMLASFDLGSRTLKTFDGFLDLKLKQDLDFITKGLRFNSSFSYTTQSGFQTSIQRYEGDRFGDVWQIQYYREFDYANPNPDGTYNYLVNQRWPTSDDDLTTERVPQATNQTLINGRYKKNLYYDLALNYARTFGLHDLTGLLLFSRREDQFLNAKSNDKFDIKMRQEDWVGRLTYAYAGKYLSEVNFAYNGTENFAPGNRFGFFPSASLGWVVSEETFVKNNISHIVDFFKIRYSYGQSGNDKIKGDRFSYMQEYSVGGNIQLGYDNRVNHGPLYDEGKAANLNVQWEVVTKHNLGVEFRLFKKVFGNVDAYTESRDKILMDSWTPIWVVQKDATANLGKTKNHGIEIELGWRDQIRKNFRYTIKGYVALNENRIVERGDGLNTPEHLKESGKPIKWEKTLIDNGYYNSLDEIYIYAEPADIERSKLIPGDLMFVDFNADGVIDQNDQVVHNNVKYPLTTYGLNLDASYKGWSVNVRFYGVSNIYKHIDGVILWDNWNGDKGVYKAGPEVTDRWTPENAENAVKPALHSNFGAYSKKESTYTYRSSAYIRLKNVELAYTFKTKTLEKLGLSSLQGYINANNLYTWTKLDKRMDPEVTKAGIHPLTKRTNMGIRVSF